MKKWILLLIGSMLIFAQFACAQQKMVFSTINGLSIIPVGEQILKEAYQQLGVDIRVEEYPGERSLVAANTGKTDGELGRIQGMEKEYSNLVMVPVPLFELSVSAFSNQAISINTVDDLKKYRIGFVGGTKVVEGMTADFPNRLRVGRPDQLFQMLLLGRIDVALDMTEDGLIVLQSDKYKTIKMISPKLVKANIYHYLNKKHADVLPAITKVMQTMLDNGTFKKEQDAFWAKSIPSQTPYK